VASWRAEGELANVLVVIELAEGKPLPVCLEVLGQARRLSSNLGATLYAVVPMQHAPSYGEDDVIAQLASHGADKVVLVTDEMLGGGGDNMRWGTHGPAIGLVSDMLPPSLLVFGATAGGREVAPRAAARMGAAYLSDAWLEVQEGKLHLWEGAGDTARALDGDLEFPVVATVPPGRYQPAVGDDEAEVEVVASTGRAPDFDELGWEADARGRAVVVAPEGLKDAAARLVEAVGGAAIEPGARATARLAIALDTPLAGVRAVTRVAIGPSAGAANDAHYALVATEGKAGEAAEALASAIAAPPAVNGDASSREGT
jgi:electron transfer flavoprotein alpha subunit